MIDITCQEMNRHRNENPGKEFPLNQELGRNLRLESAYQDLSKNIDLFEDLNPENTLCTQKRL